jgi:hypothetical protein
MGTTNFSSRRISSPTSLMAQDDQAALSAAHCTDHESSTGNTSFNDADDRFESGLHRGIKFL